MNVLLCDDHRLMREGLKAILETAGVDVVGEAENGRQCIDLALELRPHVVVMDISMPELNGVDATRRLLGQWPQAKVLALSMNSDRRYVQAMFAAGAVGYMLKNAASEELLRAVQAVFADLRYVSPAIAGSFITSYVVTAVEAPAPGTATLASARPALSPREREVLQLLAEGKSSKDIGRRLAIATTTVETHRRQIMNKLTLRSIAELTKYAVREGLTSLE